MILQNQKFHIARFLFVFTLLTLFFYVYIGIVSPGGKLYSLFLNKYANFPAWLTYSICKCAKATLQLLGYSVYQKKANNITISGSRGINIIWACLGLGVMSYWVAFVTAHSARWQYKLRWIFIGVVSIICINISRIVLIALGLHYRWRTFNAVDIHLSFNIASYAAILLLSFWFVTMYKKHKKENALKKKDELASNASS